MRREAELTHSCSPNLNDPAHSFDVVVVGAGNAGLCAALAARENGARVLVLEVAPESERGGNSRFTAGAMRVVYRGVEEYRATVVRKQFRTGKHLQVPNDSANVQRREVPHLLEPGNRPGLARA